MCSTFIDFVIGAEAWVARTKIKSTADEHTRETNSIYREIGMAQQIFDVLILIARPAAGKSEVIDYLKRATLEDRIKRFHIGEFVEIDDFPMLWTWFEEDQILSEMGKPRLFTDEKGFFKDNDLWNLLIRRLDLEYHKKLRDYPQGDQPTILIEFSRGKEHGGYSQAFSHFSESLLERAAVMYIEVSWEESLRKNRKRYNPERQDSILEHGLSDEKMEQMYRYNDWEDISATSPRFLNIQGIEVPYVVFHNEDDVTTGRGLALGNRLEETLEQLWQLYKPLRESRIA